MECSHCHKIVPDTDEICSFCRTPLEINQENEPPDGWATLTQCANLSEADALVAQLEAAEIPVLIPDQNLHQSMPWHAAVYGYVRVQVRRQDWHAAQAILADHKAGATEPTPSKAEESAADDLPLSGPMRFFALTWPLFLCAGIFVCFMVHNNYKRRRQDRRAKEWAVWSAAGLVAWVLLFLLTNILVFMRKKS